MTHPLLPLARSPRTLWLLRGAVVLLPLAGCAQTSKTADMAAANAQAAITAQTNPTLSTSDTLFINTAAQAGMAEVMEGQAAQQQARRSSVRQFGAMMVKDHGAANDQLMALAQQKKITPPAAASDAQQQELAMLKDTKGSAFDRKYLDAQVAAHQMVLTLFQTEAQQGTDPDVKAFAAQTAPTIAKHLAMAKKLGGHAPMS